MFENLPYTNFHDLNLDWIIAEIKKFREQYEGIQTLIDTGKVEINQETADSLSQLNQWFNTHSSEMQAMTAADLRELETRFSALIGTIPADFSALISQVNDLQEDRAYAERINLLSTTPVNGYYISYETGNIGANANWSYYPQFPVLPNTYYYASYNGAHVAFYDADHNFISGVLVNHVPSNPDFISPPGAAFATYSYLTSQTRQFFMKALGHELTYTDPDFKELLSVIGVNLPSLTNVITTGRNLFNKFNIIDGYSIDYGNANRVWKNVNYCYCPDFIPVQPGTTYHHNRACIIGIYDAKCSLLSTLNHTTLADDTFITPGGAAFIRIGCPISVYDVLQVEEGATFTGYSNFEYKFVYTNTRTDDDSIRLISVNKSGGMDYTSISDAVTNALANDIIIVYPGVYPESVKTYAKNVQIIGTNRDKCILSYSGRDYANPPMEIAGGIVANMTIRATNTGTAGQSPAYCVHIDNDRENGNGLTFRNVKFINEVHQCVGIGLRPDFDLSFIDCTFRASNQACLYCHDWETSSTASKAGQNLYVRNCDLENDSETRSTILLQSQELETNAATVLFVGNTVHNKNSLGGTISMVRWDGRTLTNQSYLGSSDWALSTVSGLNTDSRMNALPVPVTFPSSFSSLSVVGDRVTVLAGGYKRIGNMVYVSVRIRALSTVTGQPNILTGLPNGDSDTVAFSMVHLDSSNCANEIIPCNYRKSSYSIMVDHITEGGIYQINGIYVAT